jgi:hypothetical protein
MTAALLLGGLLTAWLICKAVQMGFRFLRKILMRLEKSLDRAVDLAGEAAANAIARTVEQALDQADRVVARGTEWRAQRRDWRQEYRSSMSWAQFRAQMAGGQANDDLANAVSLLGLARPFSRADLDQRFKKTMLVVHPDHGGSAYLAQLTMEARKLILERKGWRK